MSDAYNRITITGGTPRRKDKKKNDKATYYFSKITDPACVG